MYLDLKRGLLHDERYQRQAARVGYTSPVQVALATTPVEELPGLPFLQPDRVGDMNALGVWDAYNLPERMHDQKTMFGDDSIRRQYNNWHTRLLKAGCFCK